ncbi:MAG: N-acetylglucosamine-6-phosphate deacetylase [Clostridiales bacterium]|nr:N-acetylglucosamine-6-phosphate deacetylase [Clostridiales bacterium]
MYALTGGKIILRNEILTGYTLLFDKTIQGILPSDDLRETFNGKPVKAVVPVDGHYISPGFIDIHIHGAGGCDAMDGTPESLQTIRETLLKKGTTAFLPTTMTMDKPSVHRALDNIRNAMNQAPEDPTTCSGAQILGAHMEGPFINVAYKGAQNPEFIIPPTVEFIKDYFDVIKIITLAPEIEGADAFAHAMKAHPEITLSIGHSKATYDEAKAAIESGFKHITHLFNAMTPLHHRNPGIVGAALNSDVTCELIADGIHVHPDLFDMVYRLKGEERLILITDAIRAGCMPDGIYELGGQPVTVKEGSARLSSGTLAGSVLTLNEAVRHFKSATRLPLEAVVRLAALNPARLLGIEDSKGSIDVGKDADIIVFDEDITVRHAFVCGIKQF